LGWVLLVLGGLAVLYFDILSSIWLYNEHGIGWVIVCWITFAPLLVIPFIAGFGLPYGIALGATVLGQVMVGASSEDY
jgi:hypothetical protein